jgi:hypothetical protein
LPVPSSVTAPVFQWVDRTTSRIDQPGLRQVCGVVNSLSPFALATFSAQDAVFRNGFE